MQFSQAVLEEEQGTLEAPCEAAMSWLKLIFSVLGNYNLLHLLHPALETGESQFLQSPGRLFLLLVILSSAAFGRKPTRPL